MATVHDLSRSKLIALAPAFEITRADEAAGRCLSVSLDFALAARERFGIELDLVKWRVVGDLSYVDHWAVRLDEDTAIDLSHVQVDGSRRLVSPLADYPGHFQRRRIYPAASLLDAYVASLLTHDARLTNRFLWTCGTELLAHDLRRSWVSRDAGLALSALGELRTFLVLFCNGWLARSLERRAATLLARLNSQPDISARRTEAMPLDTLVSRTSGERSAAHTIAAVAIASLQMAAPQFDVDDALAPGSRPRVQWTEPAIAA